MDRISRLSSVCILIRPSHLICCLPCGGLQHHGPVACFVIFHNDDVHKNKANIQEKENEDNTTSFIFYTITSPICYTLGRNSCRRSAYYISNNAVLPSISITSVAVVRLHFPAPKFLQALGCAQLFWHLFSAVSTMRISSPNSHTSTLMVLATNGEHESKDNDKDDGPYHQPLKEILT